MKYLPALFLMTIFFVLCGGGFAQMDSTFMALASLGCAFLSAFTAGLINKMEWERKK